MDIDFKKVGKILVDLASAISTEECEVSAHDLVEILELRAIGINEANGIREYLNTVQ